MASSTPTKNSDSEFLCVCAKITMADFYGYCQSCPGRSFEFYREKFKIAATCTSCETEVRSLLDDFSEPEYSFRHSAWKELKRSSVLLSQGRLRDALRFGKKDYITAVFFLSAPDLASSLVLSNLPLPDSGNNLNGARVKYRITLYQGDGGQIVSEYKGSLQNGRSVQLRDSILLPKNLVGKFIGYARIEFFGISSTAALRPYAVLETRNGNGPQTARVHYHDKYSTQNVPGIYQTPRAVTSTWQTYAAISNARPERYESDWTFTCGEIVRKGKFQINPGCSVWLDLEKFIGVHPGDLPGDLSSNFRMTNSQPLMVWFFWKDRVNGNWHGQHH